MRRSFCPRFVRKSDTGYHSSLQLTARPGPLKLERLAIVAEMRLRLLPRQFALVPRKSHDLHDLRVLRVLTVHCPHRAPRRARIAGRRSRLLVVSRFQL